MRAARAAACTLYLLVGPALILVNKQILSGLNFAYPMALSGLGLLFSSTTCTLLVHACGAVKLQQREVVTGSFYLWNLVPVGACMASTLAFGNAVYLYLPVGFIQMLKAFTPTVTLLFLWLSSIETPSATVVGCVTDLRRHDHRLRRRRRRRRLLARRRRRHVPRRSDRGAQLVLQQKLLQNLAFGVRRNDFREIRARPARPARHTPDRGDVDTPVSAHRRAWRPSRGVSAQASPYACIRVFPPRRAPRDLRRGTDTPTSPHRTRLTRARAAAQ